MQHTMSGTTLRCELCPKSREAILKSDSGDFGSRLEAVAQAPVSVLSQVTLQRGVGIWVVRSSRGLDWMFRLEDEQVSGVMASRGCEAVEALTVLVGRVVCGACGGLLGGDDVGLCSDCEVGSVLELIRFGRELG